MLSKIEKDNDKSEMELPMTAVVGDSVLLFGSEESAPRIVFLKNGSEVGGPHLGAVI
jgi:hypothetical protein